MLDSSYEKCYLHNTKCVPEYNMAYLTKRKRKRLDTENEKEQKSLHDLPNEVIEEVMAYLSFDDLFSLSKIDIRLKECSWRVSKKKPFSKFIS